MPYQMKDGKWRAVRMINGQRKTKTCKTKSEAKKWEAAQAAEDWQKAEMPTICLLLDVASAYLDYVRARNHKSTYDAKRLALRRLFSYVKPDAVPDAVTPKIALAYVMDRTKTSMAAANKDRKHMSAFWE